VAVYISPTGLLSYTVPHSGYIPPGSITTGLTVNATNLQLNRYLTFWLCNTDEDERVWQVWLAFEDENGYIKIGGKTVKNACARFILKGDRVQGIGAWEYN
jgi:hypothetical protein